MENQDWKYLAPRLESWKKQFFVRGTAKTLNVSQGIGFIRFNAVMLAGFRLWDLNYFFFATHPIAPLSLTLPHNC